MSLRPQLVVIGLALLVGACEPSTLPDGQPPEGEATCNSCHGNEANAAPPVATDGSTETTAIGVGAHQAHLLGGKFRKGIACEECHVVPETVEAEGHVDPLPAEVTFGTLATAHAAQARWLRDRATCAGTYCHGSTMQDGTLNDPVWTRGNDPVVLDCGSCHGNPPPAPHPVATECFRCHLETVGTDGTIDLLGGRHIDGTVQVNPQGCDTCHGSGGVAAPPRDLGNNTDTTARGVGAHRAHLGASEWHAEVACAECHAVPVEVNDPGHVDSALPAELTWGALATKNGAEPKWHPAATSCSGSYCHGGGFSQATQGVHTVPVWTQVDGTQASCGSCHGNPPKAPHPDRTDCASCHGEVVAADGTFTSPELHIDGTVQVGPLGCDSCHGSGGVAAPPADLAGNEDTSALGVGAHRKHLGVSAWHREVPCAACHVVPAELGDAGHIDTAPAEVVWGDLADAKGTAPTWDRATATCSGSYCHGATLDGGGAKAPVWTQVDGAQATCDSCHGNPPGGDHPTRSDCASCHDAVVAPDGTFVNAALHIDGQVQVGTLGCSSCHGSGANAAPPLDLTGGADTASVSVGAHQKHLGASDWRAQIACSSCHVVPATVGAAGHADTPPPAEVTWGGVAVAGGATPVWDRGAATCSGSWCHGAGLSGGTLTAPVWTNLDGTQAVCGTCHGLPPGDGHVPRTDCASCHGAVVDAAGGFVDPSLHINGQVEVVALTCSTCHGGAQSAAPPVDVKGQTDTKLASVGAHQAHVGASTWHKEIPCSTCHVMPATVDAPGHMDDDLPAEVSIGGVATAGGLTPTWDAGTATCSNTWCHGTSLGGTFTAPKWTQVDGTQAACGTCHGLPPGGTHVQRDDCATCHGEVVTANGFANPALHVDGTVQVSALGCDACHGSGGNPAPPVDLGGNTATTALGVGAHQAHLSPSTWHKDVACGECHKVPSAYGDAGHADTTGPAELVWGALATAQGAKPVWNAGTATCSGSYCHGGTASGGQHTAPVWTQVDGTQTTCTSCHGMPPEAPHPAVDNCFACHACTVTPDNLGINPAHKDVHIDGKPTMALGSCDL
ncbi:MAG: hypothetical protein AMXMBFR64_19380 [Myxococcales bacterium]